MPTGQHEDPERFVREPWWRAAFWEFLLRAGATMGLVAGVVGDFLVCRWIGHDIERFPTKVLVVCCLLLVAISASAGYGMAYAIVRLLRGPSGQGPPGSSGESGPGLDSPHG